MHSEITSWRTLGQSGHTQYQQRRLVEAFRREQPRHAQRRSGLTTSLWTTSAATLGEPSSHEHNSYGARAPPRQRAPQNFTQTRLASTRPQTAARYDGQLGRTVRVVQQASRSPDEARAGMPAVAQAAWGEPPGRGTVQDALLLPARDQPIEQQQWQPSPVEPLEAPAAASPATRLRRNLDSRPARSARYSSCAAAVAGACAASEPGLRSACCRL